MAQYGAARGPKVRERTINFYEIVKWVNNSVSERMEQAEWDEILGALRDTTLGQRLHASATRTLIGEVMPVDGKLHLKLMLVRDEDAWLEVYDPDAESIAELALEGNEQLLETSIIGFLPYGNVIGLIQGSTTAPTSTAVEEWLNGMGILGPSFRVETRAMVSHEAQELLRQSAEVSEISVKMHTNRADALEARGSKLSNLLRQVKAEYGPMTVVVTLRPGRARDQAEGRALVREEAQRIAEASDAHEVAAAKAKLIYIDADESTHTREVDFAKQKITAKRKIATTGEDGSPIRNESAVRAILDVAAQNDQELRAIVEA